MLFGKIFLRFTSGENDLRSMGKAFEMSQRKTILVVQARCTSERLPRKVMLPLGGRRVIEHVLTSVKSAHLVDTVILATTGNAADDDLARVGAAMGVRVCRGSEHDVLGRFLLAIDGVEGDVIIRNTADEPLLDPTVIDLVIGQFLKGGCDYASNMIERTWPRGMDTEVFSRQALETSDRLGTTPEHHADASGVVCIEIGNVAAGGVLARFASLYRYVRGLPDATAAFRVSGTRSVSGSRWRNDRLAEGASRGGSHQHGGATEAGVRTAVLREACISWFVDRVSSIAAICGFFARSKSSESTSIIRDAQDCRISWLNTQM